MKISFTLQRKTEIMLYRFWLNTLQWYMFQSDEYVQLGMDFYSLEELG
jgi:hypothetical protein